MSLIKLAEYLLDESERSKKEFSEQQRKNLHDIVKELKAINPINEQRVVHAQRLAEQAAKIYVEARPTRTVIVPGVLGGEQKVVKGKKIE